MENLDNQEEEDYNVNVRMVTFIVVIIVLILTLVYFIRIYANKKDRVLKEMQAEANIIETVITDHLSFSKYFLMLISDSIKHNLKDLEFINQELDRNLRFEKFRKTFGWRKYSWTDANFNEVVSSTRGVMRNPSKKYFIRDIVQDIHLEDSKWHENIIFYANINESKEDSLKIINCLVDDKTNKYVGSLVLSYDIRTMVDGLNIRKTNSSTNFLILDNDLNLIASSKGDMNDPKYNETVFAKQTNKILRLIKQSSKTGKYSYLDMVNGINYHVRELKNLPFTIIVNIDNDIIRQNILSTVTKKFFEVSMFAVICLFMIISIYRRETMLRSRAELATNKANEATKAKTNFLAFTAHEIRSPLGFILTGSETMTKELFGPLPKNYHSYAKGIYQNSNVILNFITDILDENQIIEGKFKIVNSIVSINEIIEDAIEQTKARYNKVNVTFETKFMKNMPRIICDKMRMLQVIINLMSNSIKYSKHDPQITISSKMRDRDLVLTISDKGIGMSQEDIRIAFSNYGSSQHQGKYSFGSYGLGLSIVRMLLNAHDAKLLIHSEPNKGTDVEIIFPKYKLVYNNLENKNYVDGE